MISNPLLLDLPKNWLIAKLVWYFFAEKGKEAAKYTKEYCSSNPGDYPVYSGQTTNDGIMGKISSYDYDAGKVGFLFSTTVGAKAMRLNHLKEKFSLSQNCMLIKSRRSEINVRFYYYHLMPLFQYERGLISEHMQASFRVEDLSRYYIAVPPLDAQKQIADFLDKETARIDKLINKKKKLLNILTENLQAKLDQITNYKKGKAIRLRFLIKLNPGKSEINNLPDDMEVSFLPMVAINDGFGGINDLKQTKNLNSLLDSYTYFSEGEILLAKVTPCFENGKKTIALNLKNSIGFGTSELHIIRIIKNLVPEYLMLILSSSKFKIAGCISMTGAGGLKRVSENAILDYRISLPSIERQKLTAGRFKKNCVLVEYTKDKIQSSMEKLKELRSSLINETVTGRLDIEKWRKRNNVSLGFKKITKQ